MTRYWWFLTLAMFLVGAIFGQRLPNTLIEHPVATLKAMRSLPIGAQVVPVQSTDLPPQSAKQSWGEYGVVVGYEAIKGLHNETVLLYRVRTQEGGGPLLAINPQWITRINAKRTS